MVAAAEGVKDQMVKKEHFFPKKQNKKKPHSTPLYECESGPICLSEMLTWLCTFVGGETKATATTVRGQHMWSPVMALNHGGPAKRHVSPRRWKGRTKLWICGERKNATLCYNLSTHLYHNRVEKEKRVYRNCCSPQCSWWVHNG